MEGTMMGAIIIGGIYVTYSMYEFIRPNGLRHDIKEMNRFNEMIRSNPKWTNIQKVKELKNDEMLSGEYLDGLIKNSNSYTNLQKIKDWLTDTSRTQHLRDIKVRELIQKVNKKMDGLNEKELLKDLLQNVKQKGTSMLENVDHLIDYV